MPSETIRFPGAHGDWLDARLEQPLGPVRAYALFAHCFTCGKDSVAANRISRALATEGIATLRFDFTGLGGSEGDFGNTDFSSNINDLLAAARHMRERQQPLSLLVGHSLGGTAVLAAAGELPECRAVAVIAAPYAAASVLEHLGDLSAIERDGVGAVQLAGRRFTLRRSFLDDARAHDPGERLRSLRRPLLILHAPGDRIVAVDEARRIFEQAMHPKSFVALDGADHLLTRPADAGYAAQVLAAWAGRHLPPPPQVPSATGTALVEEVSPSGYQQRILAGGHPLLADEPESMGGDNAGPNPYDLLLSALGACTAMTLRMYARHKHWDLQQVRVELKHDKIDAGARENGETREGKVDRITRTVTIEGDLDAAQRTRLLEIADRCPVHRTLQSEVLVVTRPG